MSILQRLGITKSAISKILGIKETPEPKGKRRAKRKSYTGRKKWNIPQSTVDAIRLEPDHRTLTELAHKYKVSVYWVWSVRKNRIRVAK